MTAVEERVLAALPEALTSRAGRALVLRTARAWVDVSDFNKRVKQTTDSLSATLAFREAYGVDALMDGPTAEAATFHALWATTCCGRDGRGRLVYCERVRDIDADGIHGAFPAGDAAAVLARNRCRAQACEVLEALNAEAGCRPDNVHVFDLDGLTFGKLSRKTINVTMDIVSIANDNYPGSVGGMWLVNAPMAFRMIWNLIRPLLAASTLSRIHIVAGPSDYVPKMVKAGIPLAALPPWLGNAKVGRGTYPNPLTLGNVVAALGKSTAHLASTISPLAPAYAGDIFMADPPRK